MSTITVDGFSFDFRDAITVFKFDETNKNSPNYHGVTELKAVDIVAEFEDYYVFVEVKDYTRQQKTAGYQWLKDSLKYKFRDTFLYRFAEGKVDKTIMYICLLDGIPNHFCEQFCKDLKYELPVGIRNPKRWKHELVQSCSIINNIENWNRHFPDWTLRRVSQQ